MKTLEAKAKRTNNEYNTLKKEEEDLKVKREEAKVKVAEATAVAEATVVVEGTVENPVVVQARYHKALDEKNAITAEHDKYEKDYYKIKARANNAKLALDIAKNDAENAKVINTTYDVAEIRLKIAEDKLKKAEDKYQTLKKELVDLEAKKEETQAKVEIAKATALKENQALGDAIAGRAKGKTIAADAKPNETTAANKPDEQLKKTQDYTSIVLNKRPAEDNSEERPSKILKSDKK